MTALSGGELLARYVHHVARRLPRAQRDDVAAELRVLLDEMVEGRAAEAGRPADEALVAQALRDFGSPETVARRYGALPAAVVSAANAPAFWLIAKVLITLNAVFYLATALWTIAGGGDALAAAGEAATAFATNALVNLGLLVAVFALVERLAPGEAEAEDGGWDPRALPPIADPDHVARDDRTIELGIDVAVLYWLNASLAWRGAFGEVPGAVFAPAMGPHVPWINAVLVASAALSVVLLVHGRWKAPTRLADAVLGIATAYVLMRLLAGGPILAHAGFSALLKMGLGVVLVIVVVELGQQLWRAAGSLSGLRARRDVGLGRS